MKRWEVNSAFTIKPTTFTVEELLAVLFQNRGIKTKKERDTYLSPNLEDVTVASVGIDKRQLQKALKRIKKAIDGKEQIVVFGDYDVDGITGSAILWETLYHDLQANVIPYIPHRVDEGYGLSIKGVSNVQAQLPEIKLIITVDNGIVANQAVTFANEQGIDVIVTDHHTTGDVLPDAYAVVHTTKLCGAGVAWLLSQQLKERAKGNVDTHLELAALGTVADLVPLTGANRTIVKYGLERLRRTKRAGIVELFKEAACDQATAGVYQIGHVVAPRLNASGRMESAMDSLRLLCTTDPKRARSLAEKLGATNRDRQAIMFQATEHASLSVKAKKTLQKMLVVSHETYPEGVIGLVAGRLVEEYYRPSIVIAKGEKLSKGSVRSVSGFNIIEFLRSLSDYFVNVGGHPMAAGFTIETEKIALLQKKIEELSASIVDDGMLIKTLRIDCELPLSVVNEVLYRSLQQLAPFGMGNPEPTFVSKKVTIDDVRIIGKEGKHLKLRLSREGSPSLEAVAFGFGDRSKEVKAGAVVDIVYTIDENVWNGNKKLQLRIKDIASA